jgi:hypothetical protein
MPLAGGAAPDAVCSPAAKTAFVDMVESSIARREI